MSDYVSDTWGSPHAVKKKKKKYAARLNTSYWLPRLDEMVLLHPISTRADGQSKEEKTRVVSVNDQLEKYNRWLAFTQPSRPGKNVRSTATDLQLAVHELNALIASMMIKVDQKIADIQGSTEDFVQAVVNEGAWQTNGDLLDLTYEELDEILTKHPHRSTEAYKRHLCATVRKLRPQIDSIGVRIYRTRQLDKLCRLISEVQQCEDGDREAFHLFVFVKSHLLQGLSEDHVYRFDPPRPIDDDGERVDTKVKELVRKSNAAAVQKNSARGRAFFDFAAAARDIYTALPKWCQVCRRPPPVLPLPPAFPAPAFPPTYFPPPAFNDPFAGLFPEPPCGRTPYLQLLQTVQKWAYGEVLCGIILTLSPKLPRELCLAVFEYAMQAEGIPLNPCVWEDNDYLVGMTIFGSLREPYACTKPEPWTSGGW